MPSLTSLFLFLLTLPLPLVPAQTTASSSSSATPTPLLHPPSSRYVYLACQNETTGITGTGGTRALADGINSVRPGEMTVPWCLSFCDQAGGTEYRYAGLEYSRECWCSQHLSSISATMDEKDCQLGCDGDGGMACGGVGTLSVYVIQTAASGSVKVGFGFGVGVMVGMVFSLL